MADPVLSAELSGQRAILLSWTFDSNADFQIFWKSSSPVGQEYVLLATTSSFNYTTVTLDSSKTYFFYIRANVGTLFYNSNIVELFVSCGQGVVLDPDPPPPQPPQEPNYHTLYLCTAPDFSGGVYALETDPGGLIVGAVLVSSQSLSFYDICVSAAGNTYVVDWLGDIYMQTGGVGDFYALNQTNRAWSCIGADKNGDVYAGTFAEGLYKQTGGVGNFNLVGYVTPAINFTGLSFSSSGAAYATAIGGSVPGIYKRTTYGGSFVLTGETNRSWAKITCAPSGNVYAVGLGIGGTLYDIYMQTNQTGTFSNQFVGEKFWNGIVAANNNDVYACVNGEFIYKQSRGVGSWQQIVVPNGQKNWNGAAVRHHF